MTRHLSLFVLLPSLLLGGCGDDEMSKLQDYVREIKARPPKPVDPLPEIKPVETFVYEPGDRRDPFVPDAQAMPPEPVVEDNGLAPNPNRRKEDLEQFPLDSLRMVGTLDQDNIRWGLIRNNEGILYRVKAGNYMGTNNGQITSIDETTIHVTEIVSDAPGRWRERPASLALTQ